MKERPILFTGPMVRAILEGRKIQTRRIVKLQPRLIEVVTKRYNCSFCIEKWPRQEREMGNFGRVEDLVCNYGTQGDQFWVKETGWYDEREPQNCVVYDATPIWHKYKSRGVIERSDDECTIGYLEGHQFWHRRPSIFMARWMSRIQLEITNIRAERLKEISPDDAEKEGMGFGTNDEGGPVARYQKLWDSINGQGSWAENPWVWVIEFKRL